MNYSKSKIYVTGDIHGYFNHLNTFINKKNPEIILVCGDFGYWPKLCKTADFDGIGDIDNIKNKNTKIYFCDGNHEDHEALEQLKENQDISKPIEIINNIFYCPRGSSLTINNKNILFFGGADSIDRSMRTAGVDWFYQENITTKDLDNLPNKKIDIVISHTCPEIFLNNVLFKDRSKQNDSNRKALQIIYDLYKPSFWYFGHWHYYISRKIQDTQFIGLHCIPNANWFTNL